MTPGRTVTKPTQLPAKAWKDITFRVKDKIASDRISLIAAGVAFYSFLAIFPAIAAIMAIAGLYLDPGDVVDQVQRLSGIVPQDIVAIITDQVQKVTGAANGGLGLAAFFSLAIALYSSSKGTGSLMDGINVAYDKEETRGFVRLKLETLALTLFLIFGLLVALTVTLALPTLLSFVDLGGWSEPLILTISFAFAVAMTVGGLCVLYRYGPSRDAAKWSWVLAGSLLGCALWIVGSACFAYYVQTFGSFNESFGTLAGIVILMTWLWLSAFVVLLGAELNAEMEAQTRRDTTQGRDLAMGKRDATKADNLGKATG